MRHACFADVPACLAEFRKSFTLGLITNGASCLQREKLAMASLAEYFDVVVVSAEFGVGKPDPSIFKYALDRLRSDRGHAVMMETASPETSMAPSPPTFRACGSTDPVNRVPLIAPTWSKSARLVICPGRSRAWRRAVCVSCVRSSWSSSIAMVLAPTISGPVLGSGDRPFE